MQGAFGELSWRAYRIGGYSETQDRGTHDFAASFCNFGRVHNRGVGNCERAAGLCYVLPTFLDGCIGARLSAD